MNGSLFAHGDARPDDHADGACAPPPGLRRACLHEIRKVIVGQDYLPTRLVTGRLLGAPGSDDRQRLWIRGFIAPRTDQDWQHEICGVSVEESRLPLRSGNRHQGVLLLPPAREYHLVGGCR